MKFELVHDNKVKITVSLEDMLAWQLSFDAIAMDTPQMREKFKRLLAAAAEKTGFSPKEGRVMIEVMPDSGGGLVLFATNLKSARLPHPGLRRAQKKASYIIGFKNTPDLRRLAETESFACALYKYKDAYYIVTDSSRAAAIAAEYGRTSRIEEAVLCEHGLLLSGREGLKVIREYF